jgi:cyclophilin family peptidyl-prolyl cis-trans isomerase
VFTAEANKALFAAQTQKGGKLDQAERQRVIDGLVLQGEVLTGSWYRPDPNMYRFEARARGEEGKFKPEFTDAQRTKARDALIRNGVSSPTKAQIDAVLYQTYGMEQK